VSKKNRLGLPRGIRDISPDKYELYLWLLDRFRAICNKYNYKVMEPATLEFFETLSLKSGPDIANEIYEFKDKADRHLGLRFDLTVGLTRYVTSHPELPKPIRLAAYSVQWRYDEPQFGRYRSFYAWDIEIYGGNEIYSSAEVILLVDKLLKSIGLKHYEIRISDRRLVENVIKYFSPNGNVPAIMRALDKWGKIDKSEIISLINRAGGDNIDDMLSLLFESKESDFLSIINKFGGKILEKVYAILKDDLSVDRVRLDPSIVRGLDYYDGIVFEVKSKKGVEIGSIVGGGSFSKLVSLFGGDMNAFGAAGGVERLLLALEKEGVKIDLKKPPLVLVIPLEEELITYSIKLSEKLRDLSNARIESPVLYRSLKKYLQYANKITADYVIFIGKAEASTGKIKLRDMNKRMEYTVSIEEAAEILSKEKD
jgi:histidyl-tRNA synthetase